MKKYLTVSEFQCFFIHHRVHRETPKKFFSVRFGVLILCKLLKEFQDFRCLINLRCYVLFCIILSFNLIFGEIIWEDNFESETGWILSGEFEIDSPQGLGGEHGNPDPTSAYEGANVLGVDLTGLGGYNGDYENNLTDREYYAISPPVDCSSYIDVELNFMNWLNVEQPDYDHAYIDISNDDGSTWIEIWTNTGEITNNSWSLQSYDIAGYADLNEFVRIRFSIGSTDGSWLYSGWNIDLFQLIGNEVGFGTIDGFVFDDQSGEPVVNAEIISRFGFTYSDIDGYFLLSDIPEGDRSIDVIALGYLDFGLENIMIIPEDTTSVICELEIDPEIPPGPQDLQAEIIDENDVFLSWLEPDNPDDILLAYNIYRNNVIIESVLLEEYYDLYLIAGIYDYFVTAVFDTGSSIPSNTVEVEIITTSIDEQLLVNNERIINYPNPFSSSTTISFSTTEHTENTELIIYNTKGQKIKSFPNQQINKSSNQQILWNGKNENGIPVSSGIYFYKLRSGKSTQTKKMILIRNSFP